MSPSPNPATTEWVPIWNPISEGPAGPPGPQGPPGLSTTVFYFKADATNTQENDPGTGKMRWNTIPQTHATMLYFDRLTDDGFDIIALLQQTTFGTHFTIQDADLSANSQTWKQLAPGVVMGGDWFEVEVEFVSQTGSGTMQNNQRVAVLLDTMIGPHAYTHEPGGDDPLTALDASVLTTGTVDLARLPANVALLDAPNVFTLPNVFTDVTAGVVLATGLSTTPLDASQLTTGTVPDARLSANVQMKPIGLGDLPATVATKPIPESDVTNLVTDLAARVTGPASALNNGIAIWSGTTGKILKDSAIQFANVAIKNAANVFTAANDFTGGSLTAPTAAPGTNTTQVATTAFVTAAVTTGTTGLGNVTGPTSAVASNLASFADTTGKVIADSTIPLSTVARKDQANTFTAAVTFQVGPTAPTATAGTSTTQVATTAFVVNAIATSTATPAAHHVSHETGGSDALGALSAAILTTGVLPDARLSANVAMVNTANTFTFSQTFQRNANVGLFLVETGAAANAKIWEVMNSASVFTIYPLDDSYASLNSGFQITRAGDVTVVGKVTAPGGLGTTPLNATNLTSGTVPDARLTVNVLKYTGGYPGGTTTYLRADGTFAAPTAVAAAHATTHSPGGTDPLVNAAWTNVMNTFTTNQIIASANPAWVWNDTSAPVNSRIFTLTNTNQQFMIQAVADNYTGQSTPLLIARSGAVTFVGPLLVTKTTLPEIQIQNTGDVAKGRFGCAVANYSYWSENLSYTGSAWNRDDTSLPSTLISQTAGGVNFFAAPAGANPASNLVQTVGITSTGITAYKNVLVTGTIPEFQLQFTSTVAKSRVTSQNGTDTALTFNAYFSAGSWQRDDTAAASNVLQMYGGIYQFYRGGPAANPMTVVASMTIDATGVVTIPNQLQLSAVNPGLKFGSTASYGAIRSGMQANPNPTNTAIIEVTTADTPSSLFAGIRASNFIATSAYNNFADLTVTGGTNFAGGISVSAGNIVTTGPGAYVQTTGVMYPGRIDIANGAQQGSWYLASHGSYGLYTNTNIYVNGVIWVNGWISIATDCTVGGLLTAGRRFTFRNISSTTYNAVLGDFVLCQGNVSVVLPPPTVDGGVIDVKVYGGAPGTVTVLCASYAYYVDYPAVTYTMSTPNQCATFVCGVSQWFIR